jgi:hypothetical protein
MGVITSTETPFLGTPFQINQTIQADNFNNGGEGVAYHNVIGSNVVGKYRAGGVDIEPTTDVPGPGETTSSPGEPYNLGYLVAGDWQEYAINVAATGTYSLDVRVASGLAGGTFHLESDRVNVSGSMTLPGTGGWQNWTTVTKTAVNLTAGSHQLRLVIDTSAGSYIGNVNWFRLYTPGAAAVPTALIAAAPMAQIAPVATATASGRPNLFSERKIKAHRHKPVAASLKHASVKRKSRKVHAHGQHQPVRL